MKRKLEYVFYRFYRFQLTIGNSDIAEFFAYLFLSFLMGINLISIYALLYSFTELSYDYDKIKVLVIVLIVGLYMLNYFLLFYKNKYKYIIKHFNKSENKGKNYRGNFGVILYIIASLVLFIVVIYLMIQKNKGII